MKKQFLLLLILIAAAQTADAQYTAQGKIEFERRVNIHRQMDDMASESGGGWFEKMKAQIPKFTTSYFDYSFTLNSSLYKPGREPDVAPPKMFGNSPAAENTVYTDFRQKKVVANKQVFEEKFLVVDSMRKMQWKIIDEVRTIANYKCRKAVGRICDSVYVVAFYTEDIMVSGGPEMFSGLPGMILEIAIPRLYSTWIATKIEVTQPLAADIKAPEKGKKVTQKEMHDTLLASISKWGKWANRSIWWSIL
jgi:GLPGLI family protein